MTECPTGKPPQRQLRESHAPQGDDAAANRGEHTAYLTIAPLVDDCLDHRAPLVRLEDTNFCRGSHAVLEENPTAQLSEPRLCDLPHDFRMIYLCDLKARMKKSLRHRAVVRNEEQPLRIGVQPPHGIEARGETRQEVEHSLASAIVARRREIAARLVEENVVFLLLCLNANPVDGDHVLCGIIFRAELRHSRAVHRNAPCANDLLCRTA